MSTHTLAHSSAINSSMSLAIKHWPASRFGGPRVIGHRGACHHARENTLKAFSLATTLGADMWELDARVSADGVCVVSHDDDLQTVFGQTALISQTNYKQLRQLTDDDLPSLQEVIDLAKSTGTGLYIELKDEKAGASAYQLLKENDVTYAALGAFNVSWVRALNDSGCDYPTSVLVPIGKDPFNMASEAKAGAIHLCWERACEAPQHLVTQGLIERAQQLGLDIILWHEERPKVIKALLELPVIGICSDRPELFVPYLGSPSRNCITDIRTQVVCHRGAEFIAPENTLAAIERVYEQGFDWVEIDVQETRDGQLVVLHDDSLERTVQGRGIISQLDWDEVKHLDAGSQFDPIYRAERIPLLSDAIELAKSFNKCLYIELKGANPEKVLRQVQQQRFLADCFFWSFDEQKLLQIRQLDPSANIMSRSQDFVDVAAAIGALGACVIEIEADDQHLLQHIQDCRALGAKVMLCYQGSETKIFKKIIHLKPDLLNLRRPDLWKQALYEYNAEL